MAQVELTISEDGSATVEISLSPDEAAALVRESQEAASIQPGGGTAPPPPQPAATAPTEAATAAQPPEGQPVGPDTISPTGEPIVKPEPSGVDEGAAGPGATGSEPPAAPTV